VIKTDVYRKEMPYNSSSRSSASWRRHKPQDLALELHRHENLKSRMSFRVWTR